MKTSPHLLPLAVMLAALLLAVTGLAQSGPPPIPVIWLDSYSFSGSNFVSDSGIPPINYSNAISVPDCWGNALLLDSTNLEPAFLCYPVGSNGVLNLDLGAGAVFAAIVPNWASADTNQDGQGPGDLGFLLAAGDWSSGSPQGLWAVYVDAGGTNIYFGGVSNWFVTNYFSAPISWASNSYHEIAVTYSSNSILYLDGQFAASGGPVTIVPATNTWTNGFFVGSDSSGYEQFRGEFLYLEFDTTNLVTYIGSNWFIEDWAWDTNSYNSWLNPSEGGQFGMMSPDTLTPHGSSPDITGTNAYLTNLSASVVPGYGVTFTFTIEGGSNGVLYDVFSTTNLVSRMLTNSAWNWLGQGTNSGTYQVANQPGTQCYYVVSASPALTVATPAFSIAGGAYSTPQNVTISCATPLAAVYYTTNGATPTTSDNFIASGASVTLGSIVTLEAKAFRSGYTDSGVASATYQINAPPLVNAGPQQVITTGSTTLQGYVTDDGLPGGSSLTNTWSKVSGPGTVTFGNTHQTNSSATFGANGIYVLQLAGTDGQYTTTNTVTIAVNTTVSISLTAPTGGSTYTVPTNFTFAAAASCASGSITQVGFYANNVLVGTASNAPYTFDWKSVSAGTLVLKAVASTTDSANTGLASSPVTVTVNWPTNVGQVTMNSTDLQIPAAGLPITVNRLYDTRFGAAGSFGNNGKLDYEQVNIQTSGDLSTGWSGKSASLNYSILESTPHLITVSLSPTEQYFFVPRLVFDQNGSSTIASTSIPDCYNFYTVHYIVTPVGQGQLSVAAPGTSAGMDDQLSGWNGRSLTCVYFDDTGFPISSYQPALSDYTFTAPDGTTYNFDGNGNVSQHTDRNGNYLQYSSGGIVHSSGAQVTFTRDGNNRITQIFDPIALATSGSPALTYGYDGNGNLTNASRLVNRAGPTYNVTSYAYTNTSYPDDVTAVTDARGVMVQRYEYDTGGRLNRQYDAFNRYTIYTYDLVGRRNIVIDRLGNTTIQNFTPSGQLASAQDAQGEVTQYAYDSQGRRIAETNALNQTTTYAYDANDQLIGVTNQLQQSSSATYNQYGEVLVSIDNLGNGTTNGYDARGNLIAVTNALNVVTLYGYDAQGNQTAQTNAFGTPLQRVTLQQYDQFGNLTNVIDALNNATGYTYDANNNRQTQTKTRTTTSGQQTLLTTWIYDAANRVIQTIDPDGLTNITIYNAIGKQFQSIDKLSHTNSFYYDAIGQLTNTTYADGLFENYAYDAEGRKTLSSDRAGRTTTNFYDNVGRLVQTSYPDSSATGTTYDLGGRVTATTQYPITSPPPNLPAASVLNTYYGYDAAGRRTSVTNALTQVSRFAYDANGNQTNQVDALLHTNTYAYDALGHQTQILYPDTTSDNTRYDALERRIAATNQAGIVTLFGYDALDRLTSVTNALGTAQQCVTRYVYDEVGNLLQQIDALNRTNKFEYDAMGRRTKQTLPGLQAATFGYDAVGNLVRATNFNSAILTNQYDALNRLTNKASSGGYKITFAYSSTGQRTNMVDASGTNSYTYDTRDRLLTKATPQGNLTYTYDALGNLFTIQSSTANGTSLTYYHDGLNRLTNVVDRFTNSTVYAFDAVGNLQNNRYPNNVTNTYSYDALNRLTNIAAKSPSGTIASFAYKLALAGNRTNLVEVINTTGRTNAWYYDPLYRLTNETITAASGGTITFKYDAVGNRTNRTSTVTGVVSVTNSFNGNDQLATDVYDNNGSTRTNGSNTFAYDVENHMTNATVGSTNITIIYDGDGNRVKKIVGTTTDFYLVDDRNPTGYAQVLEELTTVGSTPSELYTYGLDLISERQSSGTTSFCGYDGNGNTRFLTANNATVSDTYAYEAFGTPIASTGSTYNNYRFAGEQLDPDLGVCYLRARYLNSGTGRFLMRDSYEGVAEEPLSLHKYIYCENDPGNHVDPSGNEIEVTLAVLDIGSMFAQISSPATSVAQQRVQQKIEQLASGRAHSETFWDAYKQVNYDTFPPEKNVEVWKKVGGNIGKEFGPKAENSCATRVSWGLNYGGSPIPQGTAGAWHNFTSQSYANKNGDDKYYLINAGLMNAYLRSKWGSPDYPQVASVPMLHTIITGLQEGQCAIFATKQSPGHSGVLKKSYHDPYVEGELPIDVWKLLVP